MARPVTLFTGQAHITRRTATARESEDSRLEPRNIGGCS